MAIDWHSSWQYIRHWKQGWTIDINQTDGGIWWQRLNECKRHQSASDYCNCHQIPPRPLTGHADPPHTLPYISAPLAQLDPEHHRCSSWNTQQTYTHKHTHTLSTCPPFTLAGNSYVLHRERRAQHKSRNYAFTKLGFTFNSLILCKMNIITIKNNKCNGDDVRWPLELRLTRVIIIV